MKSKIRNYSLIIVIFAAVMATPLTAFAIGSENNSGAQTNVQARLTAKKLERCQQRERVLNNIIARIGDRGQKQINVINSIQEKVQKFYTEKNISLDNYDVLVANANDKKQLATAEMEQVRSMNGTFSCTGENPTGVAAQFKNQAAKQSAAMKEYRLAVHELAVAIKTALGDSQSTEGEN